MKKGIILAISIVTILCIVISGCCILKYYKTYNLLENGVFCENLSLQDTNLILNSFEISNEEYVNTEYLYYNDGWREDYLVLKIILPYEKAELFEKGFSKNWASSEIQDMDYFIDWWDIPINEKMVSAYTNDCISENPTKNCILAKYKKGDEIIYYLYTDVYNENVLNIAIKEIDK